MKVSCILRLFGGLSVYRNRKNHLFVDTQTRNSSRQIYDLKPI